jgi:hypothetical protein
MQMAAPLMVVGGICAVALLAQIPALRRVCRIDIAHVARERSL